MKTREEAIEALRHCADELSGSAGTLLREARDLDHSDLYAAGGDLTQITHALMEIADHLAGAAGIYDARYILYDDAHGEPQQRLQEAAAHLQEAWRRYGEAATSIAAYHSAIGHIGVRVDPDAETT